MRQVVEDLNFTPGMKYTLSWKGGTPQVLTAPGSGHWTLLLPVVLCCYSSIGVASQFHSALRRRRSLQ